MQISVLTPSIRKEGLEVVEKTLLAQTFRDFEWIPLYDAPGQKPSLCKAMNTGLRRSTSDLILFIQDYIQLPEDGLQRILEAHKRYPTAAFTFPVGKSDVLDYKREAIRWDWRFGRDKDAQIPYSEWEIDLACIPRGFITMVGGFDEDYDDGFGWENVDMAYRLYKKGVTFRVCKETYGIAYDHDKFQKHPFKHKSNGPLWLTKEAEITAGAIIKSHVIR